MSPVNTIITNQFGAIINYKYAVGTGNNSMVVRTIMKNRFWWTFTEKPVMGDLNFLWT
jgi:hypothetical protein